MSDILNLAIKAVMQSRQSFFRFIVANEVGETGSHQAGFYLNKGIAPFLFDKTPQRGSNAKKNIQVHWQDSIITDSVITYYGVKTRNEYRMTCFGKGFPFLRDEYIGALIVFARMSSDEYYAYVLNTEEDIEGFLLQFRLSPTDVDRFITSEQESDLRTKIEYLLKDTNEFLKTDVMSQIARDAWNVTYNKYSGLEKPDEVLQGWYDSEELLFKLLEDKVYREQLSKPFYSCDVAADFANTMLNRRKSRAGKSLEHHLAAMFTLHQLKFEEQVKTEGNKRPDFIFPDGESYHDIFFPTELLVFLGAKTTCKDRWRQVLNEADRIEEKYLFTLQQGVSAAQMKEMKDEHLHLVVPKMNIKCFPTEYQKDLCSLVGFIDIVKKTQE